MKAASEELGNTPTVCRQSYIDPRLLDAYDHGETIDPNRSWRPPRPRSGPCSTDNDPGAVRMT